MNKKVILIGTLGITIILLGGYILFIQPASVSQKQAKGIAESKLNEVKAQAEFVEWEELWANPNAMVGTPYLVRTVDEKPLYWKVPVILNEKVIGSIEVKMDGRIPTYGGFGCLYNPYYNAKNLENCLSVVAFSAVEKPKEIAKNITDKYSDAKVSEPILVFDDNAGGEAWMLKIEKEGKIISRVFVAGSFAYERREGEIFKNVGGINIAFEENTSENEVKSILNNYNLISPYELKYNITYIGPFFYIIIQEGDFETIKNNLKEKEIYLQKTSKKMNGQAIVIVDIILPANEIIPTMGSYNLSLKRFIWAFIDYKGFDISKEDGESLKQSIEQNEKVVYVSLATRKG